MSSATAKVFEIRRESSAAFQERQGAFETVKLAKTKAKSIAADALAEIEQQRKSAQEELETYRAESMAQADTEIAQYIETQKNVQMADQLRDVKQLSETIRTDYEGAENWLSALIISAVGRVIGAMPPEDLTRNLILTAVQEAGSRWEIEILVGPGDYQQVQELIASSSGKFKNIVAVTSQEGLERGELRLRSASGISDISPRVQIENLQHAISSCFEVKART